MTLFWMHLRKDIKKMTKIIFATGNAGKMREIRDIMADLDVELLSMKEAGIKLDIVEDGKTFEENALIKARAICKLATPRESGLERRFPRSILIFYLKSRSTSRSPQPCWFFGRPMSRHVSISLSFTSRLVMSGYFSRRRAMAPETMGVLMEVPLFMVYLSLRLAQLATLQPGATRSGLQTAAMVGPRPE